MSTIAIKFKKKLLAAAVLGATIAIPAQSQSGVMEEVIVTAQKREENLQETAIAISAFSSDMLDVMMYR